MNKTKKKNNEYTEPIYIAVNGPAYRGAPYPAFNKFCINESRFDDDLRFKEYNASIDENGVGHIQWLSQVGEDPTDKWETEVKRAFKANGLKRSACINVKFGSRDVGYIHDYMIYV